MSKANFRFTQEDLLSEKSLLDVYRIARLTPPNGLNVAVTLVVFFCACVYCIVAGSNQVPVLALLRQTSADAIAFAASILGFLVAGFTIFVSTNPEVFYVMARNKKDDIRLNQVGVQLVCAYPSWD
jgi:formate hydrogenlyase subunit 3/multisubunit Na+/H+ antiporter MnhD subunit